MDPANLRREIAQRHLLLQHLPGFLRKGAQILDEADLLPVPLRLPDGDVHIRIGIGKTTVYRNARIALFTEFHADEAAWRTGKYGVLRCHGTHGDDFFHRLLFLFQQGIPLLLILFLHQSPTPLMASAFDWSCHSL